MPRLISAGSLLAIRGRALEWAAWSRRDSVATSYQEIVANLPEASAAPDFALARAILCEHRAISPAEHLNDIDAGNDDASDQFGYWILDRSWSLGCSLALRGALWGWSPMDEALREEAFACVDASKAPALAAAMAAGSQGPRAPWRRWCCASPIAARLHEELNSLGHQEPAIANFGSASLQALMGFSGLPAHAWISTVARMSDAGGFCCAETELGANFHLSELIKAHPEAFPTLPTRAGCGEEYSRVADAISAADHSPQYQMLMEALGAADSPQRPVDPSSMAPARGCAFFAMAAGQANSGLPLGMDHGWPLLKSMRHWRGDSNPFASLAKLGCSANDICQGLRIWELAAQPSAETGSEGHYCPLDEASAKDLFDAGADFSNTWLGRMAGKLNGRLEWTRDMTICEFYDFALAPHHVNTARQTMDPWVGASRARRQAQEIAKASIDPATAKGRPGL